MEETARNRTELHLNSGLIFFEINPETHIKTHLKEHFKIIYIVYIKYNYVMFENFISLMNYLHYFFEGTISEEKFKNYKLNKWTHGNYNRIQQK